MKNRITIMKTAMRNIRYPVVASLLSLSLMAGRSDGAEAAEQDPLSQYNVVWTTPSKDSSGSMPIGNGETGLNVWVEPNGDLVFYISRTDSWDENERLCKLGRVRIKFKPGLAEGKFKQELKLRQGEIEIVGGPDGESITARIWVDANRQVIHVDADSQKAFEAQVDLELWRKEKRTVNNIGDDVDGSNVPKTVYPDTLVGGQKSQIAWYHRNEASPWKGTLELQGLQPALEVGTDPLLHRTFGGVIRGEGLVNAGDQTLKSAEPRKQLSISIHTHTQTPATGEQWLKAVENAITANAAVNSKKALEAHRKWWDSFWSRSWVYATGNADAEDVTRGYVLQRWISACSGRGKFPIKFNGSIFTVDEKGDPDFRRWGGCYWFQNTRLPYWPMLASGDYEMMRPLFRMFLDALPLAKIRSPIYFGHQGAFFPETISFWGTYENGTYGWGWRTTGKPGDPTVNPYIRFHYSGTLELLAMMIDYYTHTGDKAFLKNELLTIADSYLLWWDKHWGRNDKGMLHMYPSSACEAYLESTNPTPDVAGLMWNIDRLLALSNKEIGADRRARWSTLRKAIPPIPMSEINGERVIIPAEAPVPNRTGGENPELYAVFPFRIYGVGKPDLDLAIRSFERRVEKSNAGWRQDDTQAAYLGLAKQAAEFLVGRSRTKHEQSRFPAFWGPNFDWIPDQCHGGNLVMGLQTMVLQSDDGKVRLLPAWPKDWDLDFKLHAQHATVIEGRVRNGKLVDMKVTPESRRKDVVVLDPQ